LNFIVFVETSYLKTDTCASESSQSCKQSPVGSFTRKLAASLELLIGVCAIQTKCWKSNN